MSEPNSVSPRITEQIIAAWQAGAMADVIALAQSIPDMQRADNETALLAYGLALHAVGRNREAAVALQQLVHLKPAISEYWNNLAITAQAAGNFDVAEDAFHRAIALAPNDAQLHHHLGLLHAQRRCWRDARKSQFDAVHLAPGFVEARLQGALACHVCGDVPGEDHMLEGVAQWPAQPAEQALTLATILSSRGEQTTASAVLDKAILPVDASVSAPLRWRIAALRAALLERGNHIDEAEAELAPLPLDAIAALADEHWQVRHDIWHVRAMLAARRGDHAGASALWQDMLDRAHAPDIRAAAAFGLAAALDKRGEHARAWTTIGLAHAQQCESLRHIVPNLLDESALSLPMAKHRVTRRERDAWTPLPAPRSEQSPIFVVGFPRSGTTLLEQMIDAHPDFRSLDERPFVYDLIERMEHAGQSYPADLAVLKPEETQRLRDIYAGMVAGVLPDHGHARLVDKNPLNMLALPMIARLYPEARIVLCLRHPCDVLLSCTMLQFRSPAFATLCSTLPRLARGYVQAFEQWFAHVEVFAPRVLEWRYESVVERFDEHVLRLGQFLGVEDVEPMKRYAEHARAKGFISTPSYAQVTQGIHRKSVDRWQAYREAFEPVLPILRPMLERLGYTA
jgi:tetratricopeptide (TPR) repeat protein